MKKYQFSVVQSKDIKLRHFLCFVKKKLQTCRGGFNNDPSMLTTSAHIQMAIYKVYIKCVIISSPECTKTKNHHFCMLPLKENLGCGGCLCYSRQEKGYPDIINLTAAHDLIWCRSCGGRWFPPHSCQFHRAVSILRGCRQETTQQLSVSLTGPGAVILYPVTIYRFQSVIDCPLVAVWRTDLACCICSGGCLSVEPLAWLQASTNAVLLPPASPLC